MPTTVTTAGAIEVHFVQGAILMRAFSANGKRSVRRGRLCVSTWIAASALVGIYIWRKRQLNDRMHKWEVTATQDEESFLDDHIETIIASDEVLPPREQSLGETAVRWDRVGKDAFIQAQGGSVDDRILARAIVAAQLRGFGIHEAEQSLDYPMNKEGMAADPHWMDDYIQRNGPYLWHKTKEVNIPSIMTHGLMPWDHHGIGTVYQGEQTPRPGHVYLRREAPNDPVDEGTVDRYWEKNFAGKPGYLRVDMRKLNPENLNPDEDMMGDPEDAQRWGLPTVHDPRVDERYVDMKPYRNWGEWAEGHELNQPSQTAWSLENPGGTSPGNVAHQGVIPPEAIDYPYDPTQERYKPRQGSRHESHFERTAEWNDIMDKARRLIQDGKVRILRNGYNNVVGYVKGDHGEYQPEIFRQDPNSRAITMSDCGCGWGEFQNQPRTRQWKKFQDRPCSHILATYWLAQATPLDEDAHPAMGDQGASQPQGQPGAQPGAMPPGGPQGAPQGIPAPMGPQQGIPPVSQPGIPPQGGPSPADVLPQFQTEPPDIQPQNPSSVPGLRGPTPTNPINYPPGPGGTFSSWRVAADDTVPGVPEQDPRLTAPLVNGQMVQLRYPDTGIQQGRSEAHGAGQQTQLPAGLVGEVLGTDPTTGMVSVLYVGKPWDQNGEFEPFGATGEHWRSYLIHRPDVKRPGPAYRRTR